MNRAVVAAVLASLAATTAWAAPANTIVFDGRPLEYDATELRGVNTAGPSSFGPGNLITNLYVTWDETYLYVALQGYEANNKLAILIDVDPGSGTGANTTTNWGLGGSTYLTFNDLGWRAFTNAGPSAFGLDYMIASEGFFNNILRVLYDGEAAPTTNTVESLFDSGNGVNPVGSPVDMVVRADSTANELKGIEARIPWTELYNTNLNRFGAVLPGDLIPVGATIRIFANLHNNSPSDPFSASDVIPVQTSGNAAYGGGLLTTDSYIDIPVDQDNDGQPDVAAGDAVAPWIRSLSGAQGQRVVFVQMSEPLKTTAATTPANWSVGGIVPTGAVQIATNSVLLYVTNDLPTAGTLVRVDASGVEDVAGNAKSTYNYLEPSASGIVDPVTVRFVLETASGLGVNPGASNFFLNGGTFPLEFGFPPLKTTPLSSLHGTGTWYFADVFFPPGSPRTLSYKYSGELIGTGTNTYEAVRLSDYATAARVLTLPTNITSLVVTDYLGAAAAPFRTTATNTGFNALYGDPNRGDAGVRQRVTMTFQLDLRNRNLSNVLRVILQGSDPLRGFNDSSSAISDFAGNPTVGWDVGGIELFDNGTNGDTNANDGIYARRWSFTTNGLDTALVPDPGHSLAAGDFSTAPYFGAWSDRRSHRSIVYKYYVVRQDLTALESPAANIEFYLESTNSLTNIVLSPFVWDNNDLPLPPPSNSPTMRAVTFSGTVARVAFTNQQGELQHGLQISTNLGRAWLDFGTRGQTGLVAGSWFANVQNVGSPLEVYRAFAGPAQPTRPLYWEPNIAPATGGVVRFWYNQHSRIFAGARDVGVTGTFNSPPWGTALPMTFVGDGWWYYDLVITNGAPAITQLKPRRVEGTYEGGDNSYITRGFVRASWTPLSPTNEGTISITYNANGGVLAAAPAVSIYRGFDENWFGAADVPMTLVPGETNIWTVDLVIPTNATTSMNFVFNNGPPRNVWDSKDAPGGLNWRVFINQAP